MCKRTGVGRIRHLDARLLWVQDKVRSGEVRLYKVLGTENPADLLTKFLSSELAAGHEARLGCWPAEGRADITPGLGSLEANSCMSRRSVDFLCGCATGGDSLLRAVSGDLTGRGGV